MSFSSVTGQDSAMEVLRRLHASKIRPSFLLFTGMDGGEKKKAAWEYAQALLCAQADPGEGGCGACDDCLQASKGTHADVTVVDFAYQAALAGGKSSASSLKVDTMREALRLSALKPYGSGVSICIVDGAESLTPQAQNAALKILEESPSYLVWIWLAASEESILPTILSRAAFRIRFKPVDPASKPAAQDWSGSSLTPSEIFQLSQRVARFRAYASSRKSIAELLEDLKSQWMSEWRTHGDGRSLLRVKRLLEAQKDLENNLTPPLVLEHLLLSLSRDH